MSLVSESPMTRQFSRVMPSMWANTLVKVFHGRLRRTRGLGDERRLDERCERRASQPSALDGLDRVGDEVDAVRFLQLTHDLQRVGHERGRTAKHLETDAVAALDVQLKAQLLGHFAELDAQRLVLRQLAGQRGRLGRSALAPLIEEAFISETAGAAKPSVEYFDYVFAHIDGITRENCLVIGDSLTSDIQGANNYGLACCWFNPKKAPKPESLRVDYEIRDLRELYDIVK